VEPICAEPTSKQPTLVVLTCPVEMVVVVGSTVVVAASLVVAIVAADIANMDLVVLALFIPPYNVTQYTINSVCIFSTTQSMIGSNYSGIR